MRIYHAPDGSPTVWDGDAPKPDGYFTPGEWAARDKPVTAPAPPDARTPEEKRLEEYRLEADPLRDRALAYEAEARAWRLGGHGRKAAAAETKAAAALRAYLAAKEAIRARFPYPEDAGAEQGGGNGEAAYWLTRSGTYHLAACRYTSADGKWLTLPEIAAVRARAKPCRQCGAPAKEAGADGQ